MERRTYNHRPSERGMTLVELTVVILIIGISMGVAIPSVSNITRANLKVSAMKLAGAIRFTYDLAARKNMPFRLEFDFEERSYWVESSSERFLLEQERDEVRSGAVSSTGEEKRSKRFVTRGYIESGDMWKPKGPAAFSAFAGPKTPKVQLPDEVRFQGVWVAHQTERATTGRASLYFFPTGMTERAVIHLSDDDDNVYTLWTDPLTGHVRVYPQYVEAPEE